MPRAVHSPEYRRFLTLLIERRQATGLTQAEVAVRLGKPQSFVAKYEGGERRLDVVEFLRVAKAIGFNPVDIIRKLI
jgi:transcriptional regulator with XRE-family HTH domain